MPDRCIRLPSLIFFLAPLAAAEIEIATSNANAPTILRVVECTPQVHHICVCTLCSCYPSGLLGISPSWFLSFISVTVFTRCLPSPSGIEAEATVLELFVNREKCWNPSELIFRRMWRFKFMTPPLIVVFLSSLFGPKELRIGLQSSYVPSSRETPWLG
jgi:hypothetical protein